MRLAAGGVDDDCIAASGLNIELSAAITTQAGIVVRAMGPDDSTAEARKSATA
jgi:hypothetical protein